MNKFFLFLLISILFISFGCSSDSSTGPEDNNSADVILVTENIGQSGGTVSTDNIILAIPANSFSSSAQLEIYSTTQSPFGSERISGSFIITGIPADYSRAIKLVLSKEGNVTGAPFIAVGSETFSKSLNSTSTAYNLFAARDSAGFIVVDLPRRDGSLMKISRDVSLATNLTLHVEVINATQTTSSSSHFKITHGNSYASQAAALAGYLEEAYSTYRNMGFAFEINTPVDVTISDLGTEYYGKYSYNLWNDWLEFNSQKINNLAELRTTAGHEFFHWVQMRYDDRMWASKVLSSGNRLWFEEASAVWAEAKFSNSSNYYSDARSSFELQPFYGLQTGASGDPQGHGYGMSAFVKYLATNYGDGIVKNIFDRLKVGLSPIDAIQIAAPDPVSYWLPDFLINYALGNIYPDISTPQLTSDAATLIWDLVYPSDTLKTFNFSSPDLSGKLFNIKLNCDLWLETTQMNFTLNAPDYCLLNLFAYKGIEIEYLGSVTGGTSIPGLKAIKDAGYNLLAMVTNSRIVSPYTNSTNVSLELRVSEPLFDYSICKWAYINVYINRNSYHPFSGEYMWSMQTFVLGNASTGAAEGTWNGNTFTANLPGPVEGYISITVDPTTGQVVSFYGTSYSAQASSHVTIAGNNIPYGYPIYDGVTFQATGFVNEVTGTATCDHLTTVDYYADAPAPYDMLNHTTVGYECTTQAHVTVGFFWDVSGM